jgi:hypothetical protein
MNKTQNTLTYVMTALLAFVGTQGTILPGENKAENHIVCQVSRFGDTLNLQEILDSLREIKDTTQSVYSQLTQLGDRDFPLAERAALEIRDTVAAEYAVMTGMVVLIQQRIDETGSDDIVACLNALKSATTSVRNLLNLIDQLVEDTDPTGSAIDLEAMRHLLATGNNAVRHIH